MFTIVTVSKYPDEFFKTHMLYIYLSEAYESIQNCFAESGDECGGISSLKDVIIFCQNT